MEVWRGIRLGNWFRSERHLYCTEDYPKQFKRQLVSMSAVIKILPNILHVTCTNISGLKVTVREWWGIVSSQHLCYFNTVSTHCKHPLLALIVLPLLCYSRITNTYFNLFRLGSNYAYCAYRPDFIRSPPFFL